MTPLTLLTAISDWMIIIFLARAIMLFVKIQKMPESAERTVIRERALTSRNLTLFFMAAACLFRALGYYMDTPL